MKFLFYTLSLASAIFIGFAGSIVRRTFLRAIATVALISIGIIAGLQPPIVGTFRDALQEALSNGTPVTVLIPQGDATVLNDTSLVCRDYAGGTVTCVLQHSTEAAAQSQRTSLLLRGTFTTHDHILIESLTPAPAIMLPHIPSLGEKARIMYFHVPLAWVGFLAFTVTMLFSLRYLKRGEFIDDTIAHSSAEIGTLFSALAYISGAIWAKFNWGKFFNWDARELSVLLLLAIYAAYFILRANVPTPARYRMAAVYAIIASIAALFLVFIVPRVTVSLHPGSKDDVTIGPILSPEQNALDLTKAAVFSIMLAGFTLLYTWLLSIRVRFDILGQRLIEHKS